MEQPSTQAGHSLAVQFRTSGLSVAGLKQTIEASPVGNCESNHGEIKLQRVSSPYLPGSHPSSPGRQTARPETAGPSSPRRSQTAQPSNAQPHGNRNEMKAFIIQWVALPRLRPWACTAVGKTHRYTPKSPNPGRTRRQQQADQQPDQKLSCPSVQKITATPARQAAVPTEPISRVRRPTRSMIDMASMVDQIGRTNATAANGRHPAEARGSENVVQGVKDALIPASWLNMAMEIARNSGNRLRAENRRSCPYCLSSCTAARMEAS